MARRDTMGLLTGVSRQGIDPLTAGSFRERQLQMGAERARGLQQAVGGLTGQPSVERRLATAAGQQQKQRRNAFADYMEKSFPNSGVRELVETGVVTPDNFRDFFGTTDNTLRQGKRYTIRDSQGNLFAMTTRFDNSIGSFDTVYAPLSTDSPSKPVGKIEILTTEGVTFAEKQEAKIATAEAINSNEIFSEAKIKAVDAKLNIDSNRETLNRALNLLKQVDTGGVFNNIALETKKFFGQQPKDSAELEFILVNRVLQNLKTTFGGVISDNERKYLLSINPDIKRGTAANRAILERLINIQNNAERRNDLLLNSTSFDNYIETVKGYKFEDSNSNVIDFSNL